LLKLRRYTGAVLAALEEGLRKLGVEVRIVDIAGDARVQGGLCTIRGTRVVLVSGAAPPAERIAILAGALAALDTERIYLPPAARDLVERTRTRAR